MKRMAYISALLAIVGGAFADEPSIGSDLFLDETSLAMWNASAEQTESTPIRAGKSKGKAFFLSFLVPGLGERYVGADPKATAFFAAEITMWLTYAGFVTYHEWRKEDYKTFAASQAGVDLTGKSDSYFVDVGNYASIYEYNAAKLRGRNLPAYYRDIEANYWQWDSESSRRKYDQLRISADKADNRSTFMLGIILANHVISAIDAVWSVHKYNKSSLLSPDLDIKLGDGIHRPTIQIMLSASF
jgi:hypothetical protein